MANTGYIINPKVIQVFTSGPNSGTLVNVNFTSSFDTGSNFTSSYLCETEYVYKEYSFMSCPVSGTCPTPTIISLTNNNCELYDYIYNIIYSINSSDIIYFSTSVEYSLNISFSQETGSQLLINNDTINSSSIDISSLVNLPLNSNTPVYFRLKTFCSPSSSSQYSNIISSSCLNNNQSSSLYRKILSYNEYEVNACSPNITGICNEEFFCGNYYWMNNNDFSSSTSIYYQASTSFPANIGWYSDGNISRYWNGSQFINQITCS